MSVERVRPVFLALLTVLALFATVSCASQHKDVSKLGYPGSENVTSPPAKAYEPPRDRVDRPNSDPSPNDPGPVAGRDTPEPPEGEVLSRSNGIVVRRPPGDAPRTVKIPESQRPRQIPAPSREAPRAEYAPTGASLDIVQTLEAEGRFGRFLGLVRQAGLTQELLNEARMSLLAPSDKAFETVSNSMLQSWTTPPERLRKFVRAHFLYGQMDSAVLLDARNVRSVGGVNLSVEGQGTMTGIGSARVLKADLMAKNGVIHEIDRVIPPPSD